MKVTSVSTERTITASLPGPSTEWAMAIASLCPHQLTNSHLSCLLPGSREQVWNTEMGAKDYIEKLKVTNKSSYKHATDPRQREQPSVGHPSPGLLFRERFPFVFLVHQAAHFRGLRGALTLHCVSCRRLSACNHPLICDACHF